MLIIETQFFENILKDVIRLYLIPKHEALGQKATGNWINKLEVQGNVIRGEKYTEQLVFGRRPNEDQSPEAIRRWAVGMGSRGGFIYEWAKAKGVTIPPIAIAYKIAREGTNSRKTGGSDLLEVLETNEVQNYINQRLGRYLENELTLQIQRQLQTL